MEKPMVYGYGWPWNPSIHKWHHHNKTSKKEIEQNNKKQKFLM
jgi:hypothetical protein